MAASEARPRMRWEEGAGCMGLSRWCGHCRQAGPEGLLPLWGPFNTSPRLSVGGETIAATAMCQDAAGL